MPAADASEVAVTQWDLNDPRLYLNRELTWLEFNKRVLYQAEDRRTPLLERVKFLAIVSSNLDEFFMKRIGGLMQQVGACMAKLSVDGRTAQQQLAESLAKVREIEQRKEGLLFGVLDELKAHEIRLLHYEDMSEEQASRIRDHFFINIYPLMTPQSIDPAHPFPFLSNLSFNLLVTVRISDKSDKTSLTRIKIPVGGGVPRFVRVGDANHFVTLEEVVAHNLDMLLPEVEVVSVEMFRVTRNANTERNEEHAEDLLSMIESELRERRFAPIVRMEILKGMDPVRRGMLAAELGLVEERDVSEVDCMLAMRDLFEIAALSQPDLHDPPHEPLDHAELRRAQNIFHNIRDNGPFLLQHPYESFANTVERFLREAAEDPKVRAIKMTLYRTSGESRVVDYLVRAARNGKQVAVVVELKARFDEAANIRWASRMEEAGIHVTYGVVGLKTHSKIILVLRQDYNGLQRYLHIGTGNYHAGTARLYCDLGLLTNDMALGQDATELFNYLTTGYTPQRSYKKLLPSPKILKKALLKKIERERKLHAPDKPGLIQFKMNALEDVDITRALYEAARDGVQVDLIVRDTCRFRPGLPGISEHARVLSVVGRFLEHARIYYFQNGGEEEYFIGSADCMIRNLESRVEVVTPVENPKLRVFLREQLDAQLNDYRSAWAMQPDGTYVQRTPRSTEEETGCQQRMIAQAEKRLKKAEKEVKMLGKSKKVSSRRNLR
ncbi:MAG: RNA degradosome polyphosphate kinase [Gammaproteobacteria bacterium RIFOXYA12_FULL_61_12]|nr:MAG: RNA degradosome polyphosphate kinase [Gammaproteobacteria bacterium RIFOXYD12_FULL_61_37]OGT92774.1 MAG: RNA degradosome polyphosphate kinase [Gammaproteobacteria bacterium RIFOXYA12_FULL_61_12]